MSIYDERMVKMLSHCLTLSANLRSSITFITSIVIIFICILLNINTASSSSSSSSSMDSIRVISSSTPPDACGNNEVIKVGYLSNVHGQQRDRQGHIISGAITYALEEINSNTSLLKGRRLELMFNETSGLTLRATAALLYQLNNGAIAFFGPEDSCYVEATVAASQNLPMISYKCSDSRITSRSPNSTFARTVPQDLQVVQSVLALLRYYKWMKFAIVNSVEHNRVASRLAMVAKEEGFTIGSHRYFEDFHDCHGSPDKPSCTNLLANIAEQVSKVTRVWIFFGPLRHAHELLMALHIKNLLKNGEHVVIYVDFDPYTYTDATKYTNHPFVNELQPEKMLEAARSMLVIVPSPPRGTDYEKFEAKVREYNMKEPFNFPNPWHDRKRHITMYASYLYDAVMLYAKALGSVLHDGLCPTNGTEIIKRVINRKRYQSVTGAWMTIDNSGDVEGNYTVLALLKTSSLGSTIQESLRYKEVAMLPVGNFEYDETSNKTIFHLDQTIDWVGGKPPLDEPPCGFDGKICEPPVDNRREIIAGVLAGLFLTTTLITAVTYRNWKYEKEIAGLLWQIHLKDIKIYSGTLPLYGSRMSIATQGSQDSRFFAQAFTQTATYRGTIVALKDLRFARRSLDLPRQTKKEMKLMKEIHHDNINPFIGAYIEHNCVYIVTEYCGKGSLQDILENRDVKLDDMFIASLVFDLVSGLIYLHNSDLKVHGNVKSSNCLVTSRWVLKLTDYGLHQLRESADAESSSSTNLQYYRKLLWKAPELLEAGDVRGTQKGDVYAFAIILHEIFVREGPFGIHSEYCKFTEKEIVHLVKSAKSCEDAFRPDLSTLHCQDYVIDTIKECWAQKPESRPDFHTVKQKLKKLRQGLKSNIMDNMMNMMEKYANNLEDLVEDRTAQLDEEKKKTEGLLHRMLPKTVAAELIKGEPVIPEAFDAVTIFFSDIVGFTAMSAESTPMEVVTFLNDLYTLFDSIIKHYDVYKVETIGDAYMVVSGLPIRNGDAHCTEIASMALELLDSVKTFKIRHREDETLQLRIGIHTGPVVAGVVGTTMPRYCLFGDTVNTASRMESNGEALKIHISPQCAEYLLRHGGYHLEERGLIEMKGKGKVETYWLIKHTDGTRPRRNEQSQNPSPLFESLHVGMETKRSRSPKAAINVSRRGSTITFKGHEGGPPIHRVPTYLRLQGKDSSSSISKETSPRIQRKILKASRTGPGQLNDHHSRASNLRLNHSKASLCESGHSLLSLVDISHPDHIIEEPSEEREITPTQVTHHEEISPNDVFVPAVAGSERIRKESRMPLLRTFSTSSMEKAETSQKKWNSCLDLTQNRHRRRFNSKCFDERSENHQHGLKHNTSFKHWVASLFKNSRILGTRYIERDHSTVTENGTDSSDIEKGEINLWKPLKDYDNNIESAL